MKDHYSFLVKRRHAILLPTERISGASSIPKTMATLLKKEITKKTRARLKRDPLFISYAL